MYLWQHKVSAHWNGRWRHLFLSPPYCQALRAPFWRLLKTCLDWEYIHILSCLVVRYECKMDNVKCYNLRSIQIKDIESRFLKVCNIIKLEKFLNRWLVRADIKSVSVGAFWLFIIRYFDMYSEKCSHTWFLANRVREFHTAGCFSRNFFVQQLSKLFVANP